MGKKSRKPSKKAAPSAASHPSHNNNTDAAAGYPSDGPSHDERLTNLSTRSASLQHKLDQLVSFIEMNDRAAFVSQFVPLDLTPSDAAAYLADLTTAPEAEGQWTNLAAEIAAICIGRNVTNIEGDQESRAVFYFEHPLLTGCEREVCFVCVNGEWRAEG